MKKHNACGISNLSFFQFKRVYNLWLGELKPALRFPQSNIQTALFENDWTTSLKFTLSPFTNEITSLDKGWPTERFSYTRSEIPEQY